MINNFKDLPQYKALLSKGKAVGYLTFDEVNKALPPEFSAPEIFEDIIGHIEQQEIALVDTEKEGKSITSGNSDSENDPVDAVFDAALDSSLEDGIEISADLTATEDGSDFAARNTDPVRMYLREMGAVPLLDRDGEVVIAKKIEMGEQDVLYALVEVPVAVEELINVGEDLRQNRIKLKDVVKTIEEDDPSEDEMNQRTRVILLLDEIKATYKKKRKIYSKLDACCTLERRVAGTQREILQFKEEIVTRLRDIKLEKTLIDRIIETVEDYVRQMRNFRRELAAYIGATGKTQEEIERLFAKLDARQISMQEAANQLDMSVDKMFSYKEMIMGKIESLRRLQEKCSHDVEDLEEVYEQCHIVISPIFHGGGMKTKTAEAMMYGCPIIGSKEAFEGYDVDYNQIGAQCNTAKEFIDAINRMRTSEVLIQCARYARNIFLRKYETNALSDKMSYFLSSMV